MTRVKVWALTGGIASGKSSAMRMIGELLPSAAFFDCDRSVRRLLADDEKVAARIAGEFGDEVLAPGGGVDRGVLRERVFDDPGKRRRLEGILHPRVREECLDRMDAARHARAPVFVADVPLLFETSFSFGQELSLLIAIGAPSQLQRLRARDGIDDGLARSILAAQMPVEEKIRRADRVLWNEGPPSVLREQLQRLLFRIEHE